jgi:16S rRNA (guanine527-N7)-methyltransferase
MTQHSEYVSESYADVSRETREKLDIYKSVLMKWQPKINLVAKSTLPDLEKRHFADSLQLMPYIEELTAPILDLGSGGGFPGLVLAAAGCTNITMVESDQRKCIFLREAARHMGVHVSVLNERIENITPQPVRYITSRALASLSQLFCFSAPFMGDHTQCLFLKGKQADDEIAEAQRHWQFEYSKVPSQIHPDGCLLVIRELKHVN